MRVSVPLYMGFAATGVGVALPGAILPALLLRWHLADEQGGRLFLMAWIGSSLGALAVRGTARGNIAAGTLATSLAAGGLGLLSTLTAVAELEIDLLMLLYGVGLGLVMTAISILRQQQTADSSESARWERGSGREGGSGREMVRLNLMWAIGACAAPSLALHALASGRLLSLLLSLAGGFLVLALWAALARVEDAVTSNRMASGSDFRSLFRLVPLPLILMTALTTGVEAAAGAWLATYARRGGLHLGGVVEAPTCLWAGLLLSRFFWSYAAYRSTQRVVRGSMLLMLLASLLLVSAHVAADGGVLLLGAAFLLGVGIGPAYPMLLALASRFQRGGPIYFLAGVASACLPWMTGLVAQQSGSLRAGFLAPLAATLLICTLAWISPLGRPEAPDMAGNDGAGWES